MRLPNRFSRLGKDRAQLRHKHRCTSYVFGILLREFFQRVFFLTSRQAHVHGNNEGPKNQSGNRWPLNHETKRNDEDAGVLGMPHIRVDAVGHQSALGLVYQVPTGANESYAGDDEEVAGDHHNEPAIAEAEVGNQVSKQVATDVV